MERAAGATSIFQHSSGHIFQIPGQERIENVGIQPPIYHWGALSGFEAINWPY